MDSVENYQQKHLTHLQQQWVLSNEIRLIDSLIWVTLIPDGVVKVHDNLQGYTCCGIPRIVHEAVTKYTLRRLKPI